MILDEPHRGGFFRPEMLGLSGIEQMRAGIDGLSTPPPMHHLTGTRPTEIGPGTSTFTMPSTGWLATHYGVIPGGILAVLADGPLGCSIQSTLPAGTIYTTSELSMSYLRPAFPDGRDITARGRVIHAGRSLALSDAVVTDGDGREVAHATSRASSSRRGRRRRSRTWRRTSRRRTTRRTRTCASRSAPSSARRSRSSAGTSCGGVASPASCPRLRCTTSPARGRSRPARGR